MKKYLIFYFLIFTATSHAFSLEGSDIRLLCPQRGQVEVILHRYEHTQESWGKNHFETGAGHQRHGPLLIFPFANLDKMIYNQEIKIFSFWYEEEQELVRCTLLGITNTSPVILPYFRE